MMGITYSDLGQRPLQRRQHQRSCHLYRIHTPRQRPRSLYVPSLQRAGPSCRISRVNLAVDEPLHRDAWIWIRMIVATASTRTGAERKRLTALGALVQMYLWVGIHTRTGTSRRLVSVFVVRSMPRAKTVPPRSLACATPTMRTSPLPMAMGAVAAAALLRQEAYVNLVMTSQANRSVRAMLTPLYV